MQTQRVPIIVGGSNSYIEKLVEDPVFMFKYKYDTCFIWIDVEQSILNRRVDLRVDQMVIAGLVDEVRPIFIPDADYTKGIRHFGELIKGQKLNWFSIENWRFTLGFLKKECKWRKEEKEQSSSFLKV
ncbi:hypothetical protein H5410_020934 [Solanum commersonii]|uniref:Uncharacterized protein n=1 Tax=Solanum commersonii TaxID=4109 RepID=A0A9J5ZBA3_SOLCO|nr:hypothetical protein H5410_020934 [Solanum commersonii]